jgi:hypothetical protein
LCWLWKFLLAWQCAEENAAAIAAGLLKNDVDLRRAKWAYAKMNAAERKKFFRMDKAIQQAAGLARSI